MGDIASKPAGGPKRWNTRRGAFAGVAVAMFVLIIGALAARASDSDQPAPAHKHRHLPAPAPTPMALPPEVKAKVPAYKPGPIPFHDGEQLIYQASWIGIPAAQARIEFHKSPKDRSRWIGETWIETSPFADVFYRMRDYMRESMAEDTLHTNGIYLVQHEKSRLNYYDVTIDRTAQIVTMTKKIAKGRRARNTSRRIRGDRYRAR